MPTSPSRQADDLRYAGIDGCRGGWVVSVLNADLTIADALLIEDFANALVRTADCAAVMVDMPIGIADCGPRACETDARKLLGRPRSSSVFSTPRRAMLEMDDYHAANAWGKAQAGDGRGLSKQAWNITPAIRAVNAALSQKDQTRIGEAHPEVAFYRLNGGAPCAHSKHTDEGLRERARLLRRAGLHHLTATWNTIAADHGRALARDDFYDACAIAVTAAARISGDAIRLSDEQRDAKGLIMEIWG